MALAGLHIARHGYSFGGSPPGILRISASSDHSNVLPWVHHFRDPTLLTRDLSLARGAGYPTPFWRLVAAASAVVPLPWLFFSLYLASLLATLEVVRRLAAFLADAPRAGWLAALFFTTVYSSPAGVDTTDPALYTRVAALPFALGSLALLLRSREAAGWGALAAAFVLHPLTGLYAAAVAVPLHGTDGGIPLRRRAATLIAAGLALLASALFLGGAEALAPPQKEWLDLQRGNNAMHLFPATWGASVWIDFLVLFPWLLDAALAEGASPSRRLARATVLGGAFLAVVGFAAAAWPVSRALLEIQPLRCLALVMVVAGILSAVRLASPASRGGSARAARTLAVAGLALHQLHLASVGAVGVLALPPGPRRRAWSAAAAAAALVLLVGSRAPLVPPLPVERGPQGVLRYRLASELPWRARSDPWVALQQWAAGSTPRDALFLTPPDLEGFRSFSRRSHFADWKQGTLSLFHPAFGAEWAERMRLLTPRRLDPWPIRDLARNYDALTASEIAPIVARFGISHIVVRRPRALDLPLAYENPAFRVYVVPPLQREGGMGAAPGT